MKKYFRILAETITDLVYKFESFIKNNLVTFANLITVIVPYIMYIVGQEIACKRGKFSVGGELFIPILALLVVYILKSIANKVGKGIRIPVPNKRFTNVDDDDEVSVEVNRTQELLLYLADLEDWLERKGLL